MVMDMVILSILSANFPVSWQFFQCDHPSRTSVLDLPARNAGRFHCLLLEPHCVHTNTGGTQRAHSTMAERPSHPHGILKIEKMYFIQQIKISAEYRDMLPRPRLDLSGTPGMRPIGPSPSSWRTSLGLGSMSRYSAQIWICMIREDS